MKRRVYFARVAGTDSPIKVGCSASPNERCKQLGFDLSAKVEVIAHVPGDLWLERNLHLKLARFRVQGPTRDGKAVAGKNEWFSVCPELTALIRQAIETGAIVLPMSECRERAIAARYKAGETLQQIGASYGITRERVRQILSSVGVQRRSAAERAYTDLLARQARREAWRAKMQAAA